MPTLTLYLLEFPESIVGQMAYISAHSPKKVESKNKQGKSTGQHTAISSQCKSFIELEWEIQKIEQDLKIIKKEARKYFKR